MGIEATMNLFSNKPSITVNVVASGAVTYPGVGDVRIASMIVATEDYRLADIQRAFKILIDYARDYNLFNNTGSASLCIVTTLNGGKAAIRLEPIVANVVDGEIALVVSGTVTVLGSSMILENAHHMLSDWMNENDRLVA